MLDIIARQTPGDYILTGEHCTLYPVNWDDDLSTFANSVVGKPQAHLWDYMSIGPFETPKTCLTDFQTAVLNGGWKTMMVSEARTGEVQGTASFMRLREAHASAEIGFILFNSKLQRTRAATETLYLMLKHLFDDLGYRRVEWKCDNNNARSKRAAKRFGFSYEGLFRQDLIIKGKNRDTAWFSMLDSEWLNIKSDFETWMAPDNFDTDGQQRSALLVK